jgi:hypothetical protein
MAKGIAKSTRLSCFAAIGDTFCHLLVQRFATLFSSMLNHNLQLYSRFNIVQSNNMSVVSNSQGVAANSHRILIPFNSERISTYCPYAQLISKKEAFWSFLYYFIYLSFFILYFNKLHVKEL